MTTKRQRPNRRGMSFIWAVIFMFLFAAITGLGLDTGVVMRTAHQLQNGADASALAAAQEIGDLDLARQAAIDLGLANIAGQQPIQLDGNPANLADGDIIFGSYDRDNASFTPTLEGPNAVKVIARRTDTSPNGKLPLIFGPSFGVTDVNVSRYAIALNQGGTGAGLIALNPHDPCTLRINGNNSIVINTTDEYDDDGAIQVNSDDPCAFCTSGSSLVIEAEDINIVGDMCNNGQPTIDADVNPGSPFIEDPLAGIPEPIPGPDLGGYVNQSGTYGPGYYSGGFRQTESTGSLTLLPGVYMLDGEGFYVNGGDVLAEGVMLYIMGSGSLYLGGNGNITITPSEDEADPYWGISIFQARDNTNPATIIGTTTMDLQGTYYFPVAELELGGTGIAIGNQLIAWEVWIHGTGEFTINYDGRYPAPGNRVYLIE